MPNADAVDELIESLDEASGLLRAVGEDFWAEQLESGRLRIAAGDAPDYARLPACSEGWAASTT